MLCVISNARMAGSAASCLGATVPIIFHEFPLVAIILAGHPTTLFLYLSQSVLQPLPPWSAHSSCRIIHWLPTSVGEAWLVTITLVLRLTGRKQLVLSLASLYGTGTDALINSYFFISILSWRYTHLFSAKLRSGCLFSFGPAWTASGLGQ